MTTCWKDDWHFVYEIKKTYMVYSWILNTKSKNNHVSNCFQVVFTDVCYVLEKIKVISLQFSSRILHTTSAVSESTLLFLMSTLLHDTVGQRLTRRQSHMRVVMKVKLQGNIFLLESSYFISKLCNFVNIKMLFLHFLWIYLLKTLFFSSANFPCHLVISWGNCRTIWK